MLVLGIKLIVDLGERKSKEYLFESYPLLLFSHILCRLIHVNTNCALHSHEKELDENNNEVTASAKRDDKDAWVVVFIELFF